MPSGCSLVTRVRQLAEEDDGELWAPFLVAGELYGHVDYDTEQATTVGSRVQTTCCTALREQGTVRQTRYSPTVRVFISAARAQIEQVTLP
jgi:hypothetical protein